MGPCRVETWAVDAAADPTDATIASRNGEMTLEQLRIFEAVAEREHVTRAAGALNLTQSAVSAAIAALEERHAVALFSRVGRRIELTHAGRLFLDEARAVLARTRAAARPVGDRRPRARRPHDLCEPDIASYWLPPRLVSFRRAHPRVTINLVARNTTEVARAVQDGAADLGLVEGRVDADDLVQQAVARDRLALVVGPTHPWASRRSVKGPDLLAAEWVLREQGSGTRSEFEEVLTLWSLSTDKLNVVLELPSNEAVRMAVEAGAGATVISRLVAEPSLRAGNLPGDCVRAARTCVHGFAASRALFQQGGPGIAERDQRREIRQLRHAHAIDARRQSTARTCRRRHFHRRGNLHQYRGATGASSTRSWRPTYAMEAKLCAWIDHAILARDHVGCARCAGLF